MVDPQPVDQPFVEPAPDLGVGLGEDLGVLDPDAGEGVDREEAPVVEVGVGPTPADQLVVLAGVDLVGVRGLAGSTDGSTPVPGASGKRWSW